MDTDVYSYLMKPGHACEPIYRPHVTGKLIAVSFVTVGELLFGAHKRGWGQAKLDDLHARLRAVVMEPYDLKLCETYAGLKARLAATGKVVADNDLWIAASAVRHSIPPKRSDPRGSWILMPVGLPSGPSPLLSQSLSS